MNVSCTLPHVHSTSPGLGLAVPVLAAETVVVVVEVPISQRESNAN